MTNQPTDRSEQERRANGGLQQRPANAPRDLADRNVARTQPDSPTAARSGYAANQEVLIRKRKRRTSKRRKHIRVLLIVLGVVAFVGAGGALAVMGAIKAGEGAVHEAAKAEDIQTAAEAVTYDEGKTVKYNGHTYALNENMVSVVVIGFDRKTAAEYGERAGQADAVMVLALNTDTGQATAIGIPRDSMVEVGEFVGDAFIGLDEMQLCLAYGYGDGRDLSCQYTASVVSRVLYNMPTSYYFALDMNGVGSMNDSIGGVALTPLQSIPGTSITEGQDTVLFGDNALRYVQWRDTSVLTSSLDRQARQVQYVKAFASSVLQLSQGNVGTLVDLFNTTSAYSVTNLGVPEFSYLASSVLSSGATSLEVVTLPGEMIQGDIYAEFYLDKSGVYETVLDVYYHLAD